MLAKVEPFRESLADVVAGVAVVVLEVAAPHAQRDLAHVVGGVVDAGEPVSQSRSSLDKHTVSEGPTFVAVG